MKIELQKETGIDRRTGLPDIWFWVRAYKENSDCRIISECFREEQEAKTYYDGLMAHHDVFKKFEPHVEILLSKEIVRETI